MTAIRAVFYERTEPKDESAGGFRTLRGLGHLLRVGHSYLYGREHLYFYHGGCVNYLRDQPFEHSSLLSTDVTFQASISANVIY